MSAEAVKTRSKSARSSVIELVVIVAIAVGLAVAIQAFLVKPYKIPSGSMEPTLMPGQRVLVDRIGSVFGGPSVGEIVVFHPPLEAEHEVCGPNPHHVNVNQQACDAPVPQKSNVNYIKRIVAGPGDEIYIKGGHVFRKTPGSQVFLPQKDSYIRACAERTECNFPTPIKIPPGHWFMMGDNRGESDDSRFWGPVPTGWIIGDAFFTYWPLSRVGTL
jgi:signal peptidase I